ncbi:MAG: Na+/H+ antiporter NhaA [Dermabacter sp.]|nr:Na+/H+ antiporter NhaA [Dermabacter sp.]
MPPAKPNTPRLILERGTYREYSRIERILTRETAGGVALVIATVLALVLANSPASDVYFGIRDTHIGFDLPWLHLNLSVAHWAADGLLAIFFFLVGLELKQEFVTGDLRDPKRAMVPMLAAAGGVAVPALIYTVVNLAGPADSHHGWAIPAATDIAFAVAVLALVGSKLPAALRTFLLTLAVVDDLIAILIIAIFYASDTNLLYLLAAVPFIVAFGLLAYKGEAVFKRFYSAAWILLLPLGIIVWVLFYNSGIHATIAGVVLAFCVPVRPRSAYGAHYSLAETLEHRFRPFSTGVAVPVFAFFSAGVAVGGVSGLTEAWTSTVALGVIAGLVLGKIVGITGTTWIVTRVTRASLDPDIKWVDLVGMSAVAGIGFTVSLLVAELSFPTGSDLLDYAKVGVLTASLLAAMVGAALLMPRNRHYARIAQKEQVDENFDGRPDVFADDSSKLTPGH